MQVAAVHTHRQTVERLGELIASVRQRAGDVHVVGSPVGSAAASAASATAPISAAFAGALTVVVPVCSHVPDGPRVIVNVKLLLTEGEPAVHHGIQP